MKKIEKLNEFANKPVNWHWYYQIRDYSATWIDKDAWSDVPYLIIDPLEEYDGGSDEIDWIGIEDILGELNFDSFKIYQNLELFKELVRQLQEERPKSHIKLVKVSEEIIN
jgi:hypothetical protein